MKKICVFTATRAEYHLLNPVIRRIADEADMELDLIVSGTHLLEKYGHTIDAIYNDGFLITEKLPILEEDKEEYDVDEVIAKALIGSSRHFQKHHPDMLVVLGDRYEILGPVIAAANARIPIAHIHGGETTEGAVDEAVRHAVTKFSYLHFACCDEYRHRIIQLGEAPDRVFNVGALGVENIFHGGKMTREELEDDLGADLTRFSLVTFHPVTLEENTAESQICELMEALLEVDNMTFIITKANADIGGSVINRIIEDYEAKYPAKFKVVASLGMIRYSSAMKYCEMVIGNSSSGILEAPTFKIPTVNIGDRQKGRVQAESIINCRADKKEILKAIEKGLDEKFRKQLGSMQPMYGDGNASIKILDQIKLHLEKGIDLKKKFYDINFTVRE